MGLRETLALVVPSQAERCPRRFARRASCMRWCAATAALLLHSIYVPVLSIEHLPWAELGGL